MTKLTFFSFLIYVIFTLKSSVAMTPEQHAMIHEKFENVGAKCIQSNLISEDDISDLRSKKYPKGENVPCFMACMFKELGIMDSAGLIQKETAMEMVKQVFTDKEELDNIEEYLHSCSYINSEAVSDGAKGCERSMLAYKCMIENASKFGFEM